MSTNLRELPTLPLGVFSFSLYGYPLDVGRPKSIRAIEEAMIENKEIF